MQTRKLAGQAVGFAIVGFFGTLVNGLVYSLLNMIPTFQIAPISWGFLNSISWAWGIGILAGFVFNFIFDKLLVFKA